MFNKLSQVIEYYQEYHLTKHKYQYRADNLRFFDVYDLKDLRKKDVKKYGQFRRLTVSNGTINREVSFAKAAINRVIEDYEIKLNNPFEKVKFVETDYIPNYLNRSQYERLLKSALETENQTLYDFIVLLTMTGCRPIELLTLKWSNVHLDKRQFIVRNYYSQFTIKEIQPISWNSLGRLFSIQPWRRNFACAHFFSMGLRSGL